MFFQVINKMPRRAILVLLYTVAATSLIPEQAKAIGPSGLARGEAQSVTRITANERVLAPFASIVFCMREPDQCRDTGGDAVVILDHDSKKELFSVNSEVNRSIRPVNDASGKDDWNVDVSQGDCEDFALTKRKKLIELGWSSRSLRVAVAFTKTGEGHAVLVAATSEGDLVLDNRSNAIKDWRRTDLQFVAIQSKDNPQAWVNASNTDHMIARAQRQLPATAKVALGKRPASQASDIGIYP